MTSIPLEDAACAIDVVHDKDKISDYASYNEIRAAASRVIDTCVESGTPNTGGLVKKVGMSSSVYL